MATGPSGSLPRAILFLLIFANNVAGLKAGGGAGINCLGAKDIWLLNLSADVTAALGKIC